MRDLPSLPMFTTEQATAAGLTPSALRNAVRTGRLVRVRRGVYAPAGCGSGPVLAARAAACRYPDAVLSHRTATLLRGLPLIGAQPPVPELTVAPRSNANLAGVHVHRATLRPHDIVAIGEIQVTSVARTLVDLARHRPLYTAVAAFDSALHRELVTPDEVLDVLLHCWCWPRIARAHRAFRLADARAESPLESVSRLAIRHLRLPAPQLQTDVVGAYDEIVGRVDFYWDEFGVVGEADGRMKYDDRSVLTAEKDRQERLEELGLVVVRWGWDDAHRHPNRLGQRLTMAFARGQLRDRSGFTRLWSL